MCYVMGRFVMGWGWLAVGKGLVQRGLGLISKHLVKSATEIDLEWWGLKSKYQLALIAVV